MVAMAFAPGAQAQMFGGSFMGQANTNGQAQTRPVQANATATTPPATAMASDIKLASYVNSGTYDEYGAPCDLGPAMNVGRQGQFFVGGEYLSVRADPSQSISYLTRDVTNPFDAQNTFNTVDYSYDSGYRFYGGYRWCDCGEEIRFTYTNFDSGGGFISPSVDTAGTITYIAELEILAINPGDYVTGRSRVELDSYDLGWSKTIPLGSPMCGDCGDDCCDPCGGYCPAWDITFTGAVRAADYSAQRTNQSFNVLNQLQVTSNDRVEFEGLGGRVGVLGRRYLGKKGIANVYMKGDISLLLGDYESVQTQLNQASPPDIAVSHSISSTRLIPVTEIEVGASVFLTSNCSFSAGYLLSAWHDLGFQAEYDFGLPVTYDDANIMGFDGYFLRAEMSF
jgi:hypothetical protein